MASIFVRLITHAIMRIKFSIDLVASSSLFLHEELVRVSGTMVTSEVNICADFVNVIVFRDSLQVVGQHFKY